MKWLQVYEQNFHLTVEDLDDVYFGQSRQEECRDMVSNQREFRTLRMSVICCSFFFAIVGFALPLTFRYFRLEGYTHALESSLLISALWCVITIPALIRWRKGAAWILIGAPLALWTPFLMLLVVRNCLQGRVCS